MTLLRDDSESLENIRPKLLIVLRACIDGLTTTGVGFWNHENLLRVIAGRVQIIMSGTTLRQNVGRRSRGSRGRCSRTYCVEDCPDTLARWVKDGLADHKKFLDGYLRYDAEIDPHRVNKEPRARQEKAKIEKLLADAPESTTRALPCFKERRKKVWADNPEAKRVYRLSYHRCFMRIPPLPDVGVITETVRFRLIINECDVWTRSWWDGRTVRQGHH